MVSAMRHPKTKVIEDAYDAVAAVVKLIRSPIES